MQKNKGFTIVELLIAMPVIVIVMGSILGFLVLLLTDFANQRTKQTLTVASQAALLQIEADVKMSSKFLTTIDTGFNDLYGPDNSPPPAWSHEGMSSSKRALILLTYATDKNPLDNTRGPVYTNTAGCGPTQKYSNQPVSNTVIYFVRNNNLYRRVLTNNSVTYCDTRFQVQSCPTDVAQDTTVCKVDDTELLKNVSEFAVDYYPTPISEDVIDAYSAPTATVLDGATTVGVRITSTQAGTSVSNTASLRITRSN